VASQKTAEEVRQTFTSKFPPGAGELAHWLWNDIARLHMNWRNYRDLFAADQATIDLLNRIAASYFSMTDRTLRQDTVMRICRITDPAFSDRAHKRPNASLRHLFLRTSESLPADLKTRVEGSLSTLDELSAPVRDLRDKRYAHSDVDEVLQFKTEPLPGISRQQVEAVLGGIRETFALLEVHFLESETAFDHPSQTNDARKLLHHLRQAEAYEKVQKIVLAERFGIRG
jgi:hypothetical protein